MKWTRLFSVILIVLCALNGCASVKHQEKSNYHHEGAKYYTSSFPDRGVSEQLKRIQQSVKRFSSHAAYTVYNFNSPKITIKTIQQTGNLNNLSSGKSTIHHDRAGTAICILKNRKYAAFVTADHILAYPDTLISYVHGKHIPKKKFIASIGIKKEQRNYLIIGARISPIHILAEDKIHDIALFTVSGSIISRTSSLPIPAGNAKHLRLGSFVYVLGYPLGAPMVTRAIVSAPNYNSRGGFLTDAVFNHGISGGLIIASNDNFRSFQWVGMATAASATQHFYLVPDPSKIGSYWSHEAYTDTVYISKKQTINYGLTESTPIEQIMNFLFKQAGKLRKMGLYVKDMR